MAITSSLSCVDYLSFKFGCQSLSNEKKSIYEHLSQELFCAAPLLKEFNFHSSKQQQDTRNIFSQDFTADKKIIFENSSKNAVQRKHRPSRGFYNKHNDTFRSTREARVSTKPFVELEDLKNKENVLTDKLESKSFDSAKVSEIRHEENRDRRNISLKEIEQNLSWINKDLEEYSSDSESELLQICGEELINFNMESKRYGTREFEAREFTEACTSKYSRKRSSTESLDSLDDENIAKRKRPSINVLRMQDSRLCDSTYSTLPSSTDFSKQCFVPIGLPIVD